MERSRRRVEIFELESTGFHPPLLELRVRCSKGTYIRTLAEDIGAALGTGAHLAALRRTAAGRFLIEDAATPDEIARLNETQRQGRLLPMERLLADLPRVELDAAAETRFRNGQALPLIGQANGLHAVYGPDGAIIGLGRSDGASLHPVRLTSLQE